jgi:cytochrome c-type biogenesis protein
MLLSLLALFAAGLLTFASPCVLPLVPTYLVLLAGSAADASGPDARRTRMRRAGLGFALGLAGVFVALGWLASATLTPILQESAWVRWGAAVLLVLFALQLLGWLKLPLLDGEARPFLARVPRGGGLTGGLLLGAAFGAGWTPCVGPALGAALTHASTRGASSSIAALELGAYALGLAAPFVVAAFAAERVTRVIAQLKSRAVWAQRGLGIAVLALAAWTAFEPLQVNTREIAGCEAPSATSCEAAPGTDVKPSAALTGKPRLLAFTSSDCSVCKRLAPLVDELEQRCAFAPGGLYRAHLDNAEGRALAARYGVRHVPTFVAVDTQGLEVSRWVGELSRESLVHAAEEVTGDRCDRL